MLLPEVLGQSGVVTSGSKAWARGLRRRCAIRAGDVELFRKKCFKTPVDGRSGNETNWPPRAKKTPYERDIS
eukprot:692968-Pyramimonas_sp.AAC.1